MLSRHPQFVARGFYEEVDHPSLGTYPSPGFPFRFASVDHWLHTAAPLFGEHNHDVLTRILGLSDDEVAALEEHEVIGDRPKGLLVARARSDAVAQPWLSDSCGAERAGSGIGQGTDDSRGPSGMPPSWMPCRFARLAACFSWRARSRWSFPNDVR